jgi:carotenoid cleavage dioxygenase-like enzyme
MPSPLDPTNSVSTDRNLDVRGALPLGLSGRLVAIGDDGIIRCFRFHRGGVSYRVHGVHAAAAVTSLLVFEGSVLACADDSSVRQLDLDAGTVHRVDLAGQRRTVAACPQYEPSSGELHLVADDRDGAQLHVVVPAGALTRRSRLIVDAPTRVRGLAVGRDHLVLVGHGAVGASSRDETLRTRWLRTDAAAPTAVHTYRVGGAIVLIALTPALERWILHLGDGIVEREVLDPTPRHFARVADGPTAEAPPTVWTAGDVTITRHHLMDSGHVSHSLQPGVPGDFVVAPAAAQPGHVDSGWLVGFVHDTAKRSTHLRVSDATDIAKTVAMVRISRPIPRTFRCAWIPASTDHPQPSPALKEDRS